jgi:uncharacterized Zn-finger protein
VGDRPFVCQDCGKAFASGSNLKQHGQIHASDEGILKHEQDINPNKRAREKTDEDRF